MSNERFECVWDAIEDTPGEAAIMRLRSELMIALEGHIKDQGWTQIEAASKLGVAPAWVSKLMRGKIGLFELDALVEMATAVGLHVQIIICARNDPPGQELAERRR